MTAPPIGHYWGKCDACGKGCARPRGVRFHVCPRTGCHPYITTRRTKS